MHRAAEGAETPGSSAGRILEGRYRLETPLGEGGLGVVWRAVQLRLGKAVAVKLMQPEHVSRENLRARFEREARSLAALSHPNIVDVIDYGVDGDAPFLVMELLEGRSLDRAIRDGIAPERALAIARDVARALAHAHAQGIAHRDLKPANVFLQRIDDGPEIVRVLDFGLAKFLGEDERAGNAQITRQGMILGTPAYMAPEQATGGSADARADVYSFGVLLFELLTGRRPFTGEGAELVRQHLLVAMPTISSVRPDLEVAPEIEALLQRATAKSAGERFPSARELMEALYAVPASAIRFRAGMAPPLVAGPSATVSGDAPTQASDATAASAPEPLGGTMPARPSSRGAASRQDAVPAAPSAAPPGTLVPAISSVPSSTSQVVASTLRPGRTRALLVVFGLGALGALGAVIVGVALWLGSATTPSQTATPPPAPPRVTEAVPEEVPADTPAEPFFAPDPDPWAEPIPPALAAIRARLERGATRLSAREIGALRNFIGRHPDDPRGLLLLGHGEYLAGQRSDACERYERALQADVPRTRGDAWAVHDLARMAAHRSVGDRAVALLRTHWGTRAVPALDRAMVEVNRDGTEREDVTRLVRLRDELMRASSHGR